LFTPITLIGKELRIRKAIKKMQQYPNIKVIAITGSYGKSSIKHYLTQVLSSHYNVVSTPKNINTDIGIANLILTKINKDTEVFVVECGAYKIGEIANSVRMFQTDFAVLSAIAPQHLSLFGSIDNIKLAKSEIANTLKESGELYLNIDNKYIQEATPNFLNRNLTSYGLSNTATLQIKNVSTNPNLSFDLLDQNFTTNLTAEHNALNLAPVISIANKLKIPFSDIQKILTNLTNLDSTLNKKSGKNQVQILDDSYNSNIDGFQSAIKLANSTQAKTKILITMGFIELGRLTAPAHTEIADAISDKFDILIITKPNIFQYFKHLTHPEVLLLTNPNQIVDYLEKYLNSDTLILIENRLNSKVHKYLLSQ
jgi:UDP-N-acetylmuramoyl-tripeptide--D-alanyl-D-alanine ligase